MKRVKMVIAYDGTAYHGWQFQPNGLSIEAVLNETLSGLLKEEIKVIGASRTDAGVHAMGNVAVFDTENRMPADKICFALNQRLPQDIRIQSSQEVPPDWHPRKQNCTKTYAYQILNRRLEVPTMRLYTYFCYFPIDEEKMRQAAAYLVGEHDFKSFCTPRTQAEETVRTIYSLTVERGADDVIAIRIQGNGFLYNMVRIIAGTLLRVGTGLYGPEHVAEILDARDRQKAGPTLPAKGLTLLALDYEKELRPEIKASNRYWEYRLVQREIVKKRKAYLVIKRCADEEFERLISRVVHQAARNGARKIYVVDMDGWEGTGAEEQGIWSGRIREGQVFGHYQMQRSHCYLEMEKELGEPTDTTSSTDTTDTTDTTGSAGTGSPEDPIEAGVCTERPDQASPYTISAARISLRPLDKIGLRPLEPGERQGWLALYNEAFFAVTGSATYDEEMIEEQEKDGGLFFWICAEEEPVGVLLLTLAASGEEDAASIDMLAIKKAYEGQGYGGGALRCAERYAAGQGAKKLVLLVADDNMRARRLYQRGGYRTIRKRPDFFCAESDLFPRGM